MDKTMVGKNTNDIKAEDISSKKEIKVDNAAESENLVPSAVPSDLTGTSTPPKTPTSQPPLPPSRDVSWKKPTPNKDDPGSDDPAPGGGNTVFTDEKGVKAYIFSNGNDEMVVPGKAFGLYIQGLNGHDRITGSSEADNINGNLGNDSITGGSGNDGDLTPNLPPGILRVALRGGKGGDRLDGGEGDDLINGNQDNDDILGGTGNDIARGGKGDDLLTGGDGDDFLIGDAGKDFLTGNAGADTFVLEGVATAATSQSNADVITDFLTGTDRFMLPGDITFDQLQLNAVSLQLDGGAGVTSTAIEMGTTVFAIVQGVTPDQLNASNFVSADQNILTLG